MSLYSVETFCFLSMTQEGITVPIKALSGRAEHRDGSDYERMPGKGAQQCRGRRRMALIPQCSLCDGLVFVTGVRGIQ